MAGLLDLLGGQRNQAQMPMGGQEQQGGGLLQRLLAPEFALPMAAGLMGQQGNAANIGQGFQNAAPMMLLAKQKREQEAQKNLTHEWMRKNHPEVAALMDAGMSGQEALSIAAKQRFDQPDLTTDQREFAMAKRDGFAGNFMDYQIAMKEAGRNQIDINTGEKLPSGYRWQNPDQKELGVEPIPGGPGEQIPGELAARIGMADSFLDQLPAIKEKVKKGVTTGPVDRFRSGQGFGDGAETYRQIESGADALLRLLTGAGMPEAEAERYARRYLPTYADDAVSLEGKLTQLERELKRAKGMAMRGRGGASGSGGGQTEDPLGIR